MTIASLLTLLIAVWRAMVKKKQSQQRYDHRRLGRDRLRLSALTELERFNKLFGTAIVDEEAETIGGVILSRLGRIPGQGEQLRVDGLDVHIVQAAPHRILEIEVRKTGSH